VLPPSKDAGGESGKVVCVSAADGELKIGDIKERTISFNGAFGVLADLQSKYKISGT
jgi:hypothetical protein